MEGVTVLEDRGALPVWVETSASGSMTIQVTELQAARRMVTRIADEGLPFGGTWGTREPS